MSDDKARILLWGIEGSGKSTTLEMIHSKLQPSLRGDVHRHPTAIDPTVQYETLPIQLGQVGGIESQIEIIAVPGAPDQAATRKQLLDEVDGIVFVFDCSPERINDNEPAITELRESLDDYGRRLDDVPVVLQYNKRDIADPFAIEDFHRRSGMTQSAVFETIATTGHGIIATLTTISKHVIRARKGQTGSTPEEMTASVDVQSIEASPTERIPPEAKLSSEDALLKEDPGASSSDILEAAILAEAELTDADEIGGAIEVDSASFDTQPDWSAVAEDSSKTDPALGAELRIVSAGTAEVDSEGGLRVPLVLGDDAGQTRSVVLSLRLDTLVENGDD
jgi:signal recognition particle receptor subunit beta